MKKDSSIIKKESLQKIPVEIRKGLAMYIFANQLSCKKTKGNDQFMGSIILAQSNFNKNKSDILRAGIQELIDDLKAVIGEDS